MRRAVSALFFIAVTFLALLATFILAAEKAPKKNAVVTFTHVADLDSQVNNGNRIWMIQFAKTTGCPECDAVAPQFEKAAAAMEGTVPFALVTDPDAATKFDIKSFPAFKIFTPDDKKGKHTLEDFTNERTAEAFTAASVKAVKALVEARVPPPQDEPPRKTPGGFYENTEVIELDDERFEKEVLGGDNAWLIEFYAPWCGHCKQLTPAWKAAAAAGTGVKVAAVDATVHTKFSNKYGVQGFPTIKFFKPSEPEQTPEDFNGGRTEQAIVTYLEEKAAIFGKGTPVVISQIENQEQLESDKCLKNKLLCVVFVLPHVAFTGAAGRNDMLAVLGKVSAKFRNRNAGFGWISGGEHSKFESAFGVQDNYPSFVAFGQSKGQIKFTIPQGEKFDLEGISGVLDKILGGRKGMSILKGTNNEVPKLSKGVALWDGKDYVETD